MLDAARLESGVVVREIALALDLDIVHARLASIGRHAVFDCAWHTASEQLVGAHR